MLLSLIMLAQVSAQPLAATPPPLDPNKVICRTIDRTGSRLARDRICMTRAQWDERTRNDRRETEQMQANMGRCLTSATGKDCGG
jgi:hypothetical protein